MLFISHLLNVCLHQGDKTTGNDLDNAWIAFDNVMLTKDRLLNKYADVIDDKYVQTTDEKMRIEIIGQRLLSGVWLFTAQPIHSFTGHNAMTAAGTLWGDAH